VSKLTVRRAAPDDVAAIHRLIVALAVYEGEPDAVKATPESLGETLFGDHAMAHAFVAERDGAVVGVALWFLNYSTWTGRPGLYLEDLFVAEEARGTGAGRALFRALAAEAVARGCPRLDWAVLDWNESAKTFYRHIGARRSEGWEPWRLEGEALAALAAE
jgi:GNAT superfamily N-acetyltransferase